MGMAFIEKRVVLIWTLVVLCPNVSRRVSIWTEESLLEELERKYVQN